MDDQHFHSMFQDNLRHDFFNEFSRKKYFKLIIRNIYAYVYDDNNAKFDKTSNMIYFSVTTDILMIKSYFTNFFSIDTKSSQI